MSLCTNALSALVLTVLSLAALVAYNAVTVQTWQRPYVPPSGDAPVLSEAMLQRLQAGLRLPTITYDDMSRVNRTTFTELHDLLRRSYPLVHARLPMEVISGMSLLYKWQGHDTSLKPILTLAHLDVVPIEEGTEHLWTHPPFAAERADGYIWARGAMDFKSSVFAIFESVEYLLSHDYAPKRTVYLAFGHDEEVDGIDGAAVIAKVLLSRGIDCEFLLDEGLPVIDDDLVPGVPVQLAGVAIAEKGWLTVELSVNVTGGHSSNPPAHTSIGILSELVTQLERNPFPLRFKGPARTMFEALAADMPPVPRIVLANLWLVEPFLPLVLQVAPILGSMFRTTQAVTTFNAGVKKNVLASRATATVNYRIATWDNVAAVRAHIQRCIDANPVTRAANIHVNTVGIVIEPSPVSDAHSRGYGAVADAIRQVFDAPPKPLLPKLLVVPGLFVANTDSRAMWNVTRTILRFSPLVVSKDDVARIHGVDERIAIDNYAQALAFYTHFLRGASSH